MSIGAALHKGVPGKIRKKWPKQSEQIGPKQRKRGSSLPRVGGWTPIKRKPSRGLSEVFCPCELMVLGGRVDTENQTDAPAGRGNKRPQAESTQLQVSSVYRQLW